MILHLGTLVVTKVWSQKQLQSAHKDESGESVLVYGPEEWWITVQPGNLAFKVGSKKPTIIVGDSVELTIQKPSQPEPKDAHTNPPTSN